MKSKRRNIAQEFDIFADRLGQEEHLVDIDVNNVSRDRREILVPRGAF